MGTTLELQNTTHDMKTILVTKDINMRIKARSIGLTAEDYINDKVMNIEVFNKSETIFEILTLI